MTAKTRPAKRPTRRGPKRKPATERKNRALSVSVTESQHRRIEKAAWLAEADSTSAWVREILLRSAEKVLAK